MRNSILVVTISLALAACGAGGSLGVSPLAPETPASRTTIAVKLTIPAPLSRTMRGRHYVSGATQGVGISYGATPFTFPVNTSPTQAYSVSALSPLCVANPDGSRTCTLPIGPSPGTVDFQLSAWDTVPSNGAFTGAKLLSTATILGQAVSPGVTNNLAFTLDGVVNSVHISLSPTSLPAAAPGGAAQTAALSVVAEDASGSVIVGAGSYVDVHGNPLTIGVMQASTIATEMLRTTLSAATVTPSANTITVTYAGNSSSGTTFTPTVTGGTASGGTLTGALPITLPAGGPIVSRYALTSGAFPLAITSGADGNLWFVEAGLGKIGKVNPSTAAVTEYALAGGAPDYDTAAYFPQDIVSGPDGNMWFTENGDNKIGKITSTGSITEYSTGAASPESIAKGADGNLWFTECPPALGNVSTSGTVSGPYLGTTLSGHSVDAITTGPDNNLWFTDADGAIDTVSPTSPTALTTHPYTTTGSPQAISSDPVHSQLLFSELNGSFGTVSTSGTVTLSSAVSGQNILGIVAGPDGNAWYANCLDDSIGRVINGAVTVYPVTALSAPYGITIGPDGNIWFTERGDDHIDRLIY